MHKLSITGIASVVLALSALPALALNTRTWISGAGTDNASCGAIATPCRTLQWAHDHTSPGGEIDVKDSAGYGAIVITKAISIIGDGSLAGVLAPANGNAIEINAAPTEIVVLRGLTVEGAGIGANGIVFNSGHRLDIVNCSVQKFHYANETTSGYGVLLQPLSGESVITISNTTISGNDGSGLRYQPPNSATSFTQIAIDRVLVSNNKIGLEINNVTSSGAASAVITNSVVSANGIYGISISKTSVSIDLCVVEHNGYSGVVALNAGSIVIGRSLSVRNGQFGLENGGGTSTVSSYKDNRLDGNGSGPTSGTIIPATLN